VEGRVASLAVWGRPLPPTEVKSLATAPTPWAYAGGYPFSWREGGILAYFSLEEGGEGGKGSTSAVVFDSFLPKVYQVCEPSVP
jgi:hypothetical protein